MSSKPLLNNENIIFMIVPIFFTFLMVSLCNSPHKKLNLMADNNGQNFVLYKQADIFISLKANPTAGYTWSINEMDTSIIDQVGNFTFDADSKKIGTPGMQTFHFKSIAPGETKLKLIYHRTWERNKDPLDTYIVHFNVKE